MKMKNKIVFFVFYIGCQMHETSSQIIDQSNGESNSAKNFISTNNLIYAAIYELRIQVFDKMGKMEAQLVRNTEEVGRIGSNIVDLKTEIETIGKLLVTIGAKAENIGTAIAKIEKRFNSTESTCEIVKRNIESNIGAKIDTKTSSIEENLTNIAQMETNFGNNATAIKNIESNFVDIKTKMENIDSKLGSRSVTPYLDTTTGNLEDKIGIVETNVSYFKFIETEIRSIETALNAFTATSNCSEKQSQEPKTMDCSDVAATRQLVSCYEYKRYRNNSYGRVSGVYEIFLPHHDETEILKCKNVYCDMESDGGGWTVFQRRGIPGNLTETDRSDLFNKTWIEYKNGFGDPNYDYWLGLETIRPLTKDCNHELLITATHIDGSLYQAHYSTFGISSEEDKFRLSVGGYIKENSTLTDGLTDLSGMRFSTIDRDYDGWGGGSCSEHIEANGFWFKDCGEVSLNGMYPSSLDPDTFHEGTDLGISWFSIKYLKLKRTEMKIRPKC